MQTFLPCPDLLECARSLDDRRLAKQRVETYQILRALTWHRYGWKNHPAVVMWRGFVPALVLYGLVVCQEWADRGHAEAVGAQLLTFTGGRVPRWQDLLADGGVPPWFGDPDLHASHRAALLRKHPDHYAPLWPSATTHEGYVWPGSPFPRWPTPGAWSGPLDVQDARTPSASRSTPRSRRP